MCLIVLALQAHPTYPLILVANRDEFHQRPTDTADFWQENPTVLAGKDLEAGGTWLGVNRFGRFAALTNVRGNPPSTAPLNFTSRGELCRQLLCKRQHNITEQLDAIHQVRHQYQGFNLITGELTPSSPKLYYYSNQQQSYTKTELTPGIHGLSNAALNTPWPKVNSSVQELASIISEPFAVEDLLALMLDTSTAQDDALPDTGIGIEKEKLLSSRFIQSNEYGTRCTTVITMNTAGELAFIEQSYDPQGQVVHRVNHQLQFTSC